MNLRSFTYVGACLVAIARSPTAAAESRLGNFFTSQRVIERDEFYVNITD